MKRVVSILIAVIVIGAVFANAAAIGNDDGVLQVVIGTVSAEPGDTVSIGIELNGNGPNTSEDIVSLLAVVTWSEKLTLTDAVYNCDLNEDGVKKSRSLIHTPKKTKYVFVDGRPSSIVDWKDTQSPYAFNWLALDPADAIGYNGTFVTLTFKVADDAEGNLPVTAEIDPENLFDANGNNVRFEITQGAVEIPAAATGLAGDANGDGTVNGRDLIRLRKYLNGYNDETGTSVVSVTSDADCTGDGLINGKDLIRLRKILNSSGVSGISGDQRMCKIDGQRQYVF